MSFARVTSREVFLPSPAPNAAVHAATYYTTAKGLSQISVHGIETRSDTIDVGYERLSEDNGRSWGPTIERPTRFEAEGGTGRRHFRGHYVDVPTGRLLAFWSEGVLPTDHPLEGMKQWALHYSVSTDGGRTQTVSEQIVHEGEGYDTVHHLPGVTKGRNCVMMGDLGERPLTRSDGVILLPVQSSPTGPDGSYHNPGAGYTYTDCMVLMGTWTRDGRLSWRASERIVGDPGKTTRGLIEPTLAELADGRLLVVMRGSNDARPEYPGHKWCSWSSDGGATWTEAKPWSYESGEAFHSPSACSQLVPWRDGRILWVGNICPQNPRGNSPRYPLVVAEVNPRTGLVVKATVTAVDDRQPGEHQALTLSNFYAREDRETGELVIHLSRLFAGPQPERGHDWTADARVIRVEV